MLLPCLAMQTSPHNKQILLGIAIILFSILFSSPAVAQPVRAGFLYTLANFTGPIKRDFSRVAVDMARTEIYVLYQNNVTVFNDAGMEVYRFGDDLDLGQLVDVAVDEEGDVLLLSYKESRWAIIRCNFRGEPKSQVELGNLPRTFSNFSPNRMIYRGGSYYLASTIGMRLVVADRQGTFKKGYDLVSLFDLEEKDRENTEVFGFDVDREGNILLTVPVLFRVYILSPDGKLNYFGQPGGAPGRFNIVAGVVRDSQGNYLVVDKLKCSVSVFDKNFKYITQFGTRGYKPGNLIAPEWIAIDSRDRVYVTQLGRRGVSAYNLSHN